MQLTLWEENALQPRKRRSRTNAHPHIAPTAYSITGVNDCSPPGIYSAVAPVLIAAFASFVQLARPSTQLMRMRSPSSAPCIKKAR